VGGGISGLVCAYALRKAGIDAQLVEASPRPGGVIRSERRDGFLLELGPQSFNGTAPLIELCRDLGIEGQLVQAPRHAARYVLVDGALRQVPLSPPAFFASSLFGAGTKWSILRDLFGRSRPPEEDESVAAFVRRKFSAELLEKLVGPFVSGIYAGDPERLSLRGAFAQLHAAEKSAGSIVRGMMRAARAKKGPRERPTLLSFRDGNETLIHALATRLGSALRCGAEVTRIQPGAGGAAEKFEVRINAGGSEEIIEAGQLILATPTNVSAKLLNNVDVSFERALGGVVYAPVAIVSLGYRKSDVGYTLEGFGFLVPRSAGLSILGSVWNSSLFQGRAPDGHVLLTSFVGGATDPQAVTRSSPDLISLVHKEITPVLHLRKAPIFSNVEIYERAIPQYNLGYTHRLEALEALRPKYPDLWLTGNYLRGPAIGACVEQALAVAEGITKRISK